MAAARLTVERSSSGRLEGSLTTDDGAVEHGFSGTLELMRLLEELVDATGGGHDVE